MIYSVRDMSFAYGEREVLSRVSASLEEGELCTVLGRNGAGKSTFFSCLLGLLRPQSGEITLCGRPIGELKPREISALVSYVPQNHVPAFEYRVFDFVLMGCASSVSLFARPGKEEERRAWEALERLGLSAFADAPYTELSGGERQQVTIARALAARPKAILFDEPTAHLDSGNQLRVLRLIRELASDGYAVYVTTHDPNHAILLGGNVLIFDGKGGAEGGSAEEMICEEKLAAIYGPELKIRYLEEFGRRVCIYPSL